jgi:DNA-binding winged helix-turn-helix (wHTH) protein
VEKGVHATNSENEPLSNVRFGPFELDLRRRALRKQGRRIRLQEQPFQILRMLVESPGEVVSRDDIRNRLWPDGTVVDFDHSINSAVKRLREALCDSADNPRYIATLARRGYRFIGEVEGNSSIPAESVIVIPSPQLDPTARRSGFELRHRIPASVAFAVVIGIVVGGTTYYNWRARHARRQLQPLMRLDVDLGTEASSQSDRGTRAILSPDGALLVYLSRSKLFARRLDQANAAELPGTERAQAPFFSPDGKWVAFFAENRLRKVSLQTGQVVDICAAALGYGGSWGEDGNIVVAANVYLSRIPANGGKLMPVTQLEPGEIAHRWPQILPGGKAMLFSAYRSTTGLEGATIEVQSLHDRGAVSKGRTPEDGRAQRRMGQVRGERLPGLSQSRRAFCRSIRRGSSGTEGGAHARTERGGI